MPSSSTDRASEKVDALLALKAGVQSLTAADWETQRTPLVTFFESRMEAEDYPFLQSLGEMREAQSEISAPLLFRAEELFGRLRHPSGEIPGVPQMETEEEILEVVFPVRYLQGGKASYGREIPADLTTAFAKFVEWWNVGGKKRIFAESEESSAEVQGLLEALPQDLVSTCYVQSGSDVSLTIVRGYLPPTGGEWNYPAAWYLSQFPWSEDIWDPDFYVAGEYLDGLMAGGRGSCTSCRARWGLEPDADCEDCSGFGTQMYEFEGYFEMISEDW